MPRAATTLDPFNAIAEPKRRQVIDVLFRGERSVNDLVSELGWPQPMVSKHLGVLSKVGVVQARHVGRQRLYRLDGQKLKPIHDWVSAYKQLWEERLDRLDAYIKELQSKSDQ